MSHIADEAYLYLTTAGWKSGRTHRIEIWFTAEGDRLYVISERGRRAHWVQNLARNPAVVVQLGSITSGARARIVTAEQEPGLHAKVLAASRAKYGWGDGLVVELTPGAAQEGGEEPPSSLGDAPYPSG